MSRFVVQQWVEGTRWQDVLAPVKPGGNVLTWEAEDAGDAFRMAVLNNPDHRLVPASYRVLPYEQGAGFTVEVNIDGQAHEPPLEAPLEERSLHGV